MTSWPPNLFTPRPNPYHSPHLGAVACRARCGSYHLLFLCVMCLVLIHAPGPAPCPAPMSPASSRLDTGPLKFPAFSSKAGDSRPRPRRRSARRSSRRPRAVLSPAPGPTPGQLLEIPSPLRRRLLPASGFRGLGVGGGLGCRGRPRSGRSPDRSPPITPVLSRVPVGEYSRVCAPALSFGGDPSCAATSALRRRLKVIVDQLFPVPLIWSTHGRPDWRRR